MTSQRVLVTGGSPMINSTTALPEPVLAWVSTHTHSAIVDVRPIGAGITNTKLIITLDQGDPLVLRWSDPQVWGETGREHVRREAQACRLLADTSLPVPRLIASDDDGRATGGSANLLTWLPGRVRHDRLGPDALRSLASITVDLHRQPVTASVQPPTFSFRGPPQLDVPPWTQRPDLWRRAIDLRSATPSPSPYGLIHRDFHLGNILWEGDTVTGLVDWAETSWGPADLDVAHLCSDLALLGHHLDVETFRTIYQQLGGHLDADPGAARFWAVSDILGFLPDPAHVLPAFAATRPELSADDVRLGLEDLLAATLT